MDRSSPHWKPRRLPTLSAVAARAASLHGVPRRALRRGDAVVVETRNSIYRLLFDEDGQFEVRGGWFSREGCGAKRVTVAGCTFGGSALWEEMIAAPSLFLEFGNGVRTTRIQRVWVERADAAQSLN